jgi:peptidoglycan-N-acetylglucosamine deacetylase
MHNINPSFLFRFFSRKYLYCSIPAKENELFLTFDDGPCPEVTPEILRILEEKRARATFFCVGGNAGKYKELLNQILDQGHAIGNHTFSHLDGWKTPPGEYAENITRCEEFFQTDLFRPPYGRFSLGQYWLLRKKYKFIMWSVLSGDFHKGTSAEQCLSNVINNAGSGSVILFHDSIRTKEKVLYALPRVIDHFQARGYRFVPVRLS